MSLGHLVTTYNQGKHDPAEEEELFHIPKFTNAFLKTIVKIAVCSTMAKRHRGKLRAVGIGLGLSVSVLEVIETGLAKFWP